MSMNNNGSRDGLGQGSNEENLLCLGAIRLDVSQRLLLIGGRQIHLGESECLVLESLLGARGRSITPGAIAISVWGGPGEDNQLKVRDTVRRLRRKLREARAIETIVGEGYRVADL